MANDTQTPAYKRGYADGYRAGLAGSPHRHAASVQMILRVICEAGLLWVIDAQGHKCEAVRPGGRVTTGPAGDRYELALYPEDRPGIGEDLAAIGASSPKPWGLSGRGLTSGLMDIRPTW